MTTFISAPMMSRTPARTKHTFTSSMQCTMSPWKVWQTTCMWHYLRGSWIHPGPNRCYEHISHTVLEPFWFLELSVGLVCLVNWTVEGLRFDWCCENQVWWMRSEH